MSTVSRSALPLLVADCPPQSDDRVVELPSVPAPIPAGDDLLRQAGRLRFRDPAIEARYHIDRFSSVLMRERVTMASCAIVTTAIGLYEAYTTSLYRIEGLVMFLHVMRLYVVMPMWMGVFLLTFWRGFPRWADPVNATVTTLSCWGHSLMIWAVVHAVPGIDLTNALTGSTILVLVVAIFSLPMRFGSLFLTVLLSIAGPILFFLFTLGVDPASPYSLRSPCVSLTLVGSLIIMGGWFREAADRRLFAQRENANTIAGELATANAELARMNAEQNEFMAIASHDLRAPLATVRHLLELMEAGHLESESQRRHAVAEMKEQSGRMLELVTDYLSVHAAESGEVPVRLARLDLGAMSAAVRTRLHPVAVAKNQRLEADTTPVPVWVTADECLLHQITDNFVTNAIKFSPPGATVHLEIQIADTIRRARLAVIDDGPGISPDDQARLFRKFSRAETRPTAGEPSTGLGLAVAKRLAETMGGKVGCDSTPGEGSSFWIELPLAG